MIGSWTLGLLALLSLSLAQTPHGHVTWPKCFDHFPGRFITTLPDYYATDLDIRYCHMTRIHRDEFIGLPNLTNIDASSNDNLQIHPAAFKSVPKLTHLKLDNNNISSLPVFQTHSFPSLIVFYLYNNKITGISDPRTFTACVKLQDLSLTGNQIEYVHPDVFKSLSELKFLDLSNNMITCIPESMFLNNKKLEYLHLYGNRIAYLPKEFASNLKRVGQIGVLYFYNNPWHCSCLLEMFADVKRAGVRAYTDLYEYSMFNYDGTFPVCVYAGRYPCQR